MSTTDGRKARRRQVARSVAEGGLTLVELMVALALAVFLIAAIAPLVTSISRAGVDEADRTLHAVQARVAFARFEQDLRMAAGLGSPLPVASPILEATATRVVLLTRAEVGEDPLLVEWEIRGSSIMRRWGQCPNSLPDTFGTALFIDNKTMLEGLRSGSRFMFAAGVAPLEPPLDDRDLMRIYRVALQLVISPVSAGGPLIGRTVLATWGRVGR